MAELVSMDVENNSTDEKKLFTVKKWNAVALWSYNIRMDMCAICRCNIAEPCIECQAKEKPEDQESMTFFSLLIFYQNKSFFYYFLLQ